MRCPPPSEPGTPGAGEPTGVFVYGTLRSGRSNAGVLRPRERFAARLHGGVVYDLPDRGYPVLRLGEGEAPIRGELLLFDDLPAALAFIDHFEGCGERRRLNLYTRGVVEVELESGETRVAWVYHLIADEELPAEAEAVDSGDWGA